MEYVIKELYARTYTEIIDFEKAYIALSLFSMEIIKLFENHGDSIVPQPKTQQELRMKSLDDLCSKLFKVSLGDFRNILGHQNYYLNFNGANMDATYPILGPNIVVPNFSIVYYRITNWKKPNEAVKDSFIVKISEFLKNAEHFLSFMRSLD